MTRDDVLEMASQCGAVIATVHPGGHTALMDKWNVDLERFAALVAERTREECARVCDGIMYLTDAAAAIRSMKAY